MTDPLTLNPGRGRLGNLLSSPATRALAALMVVFTLGLVFNAEGAFFKWGTHRDMFRQVSVFGILSCGMTLVIITGGIDLSVGSILALCAVLFSLFSIHLGWPAALTVVVCIAAGTVLGAASGALVARFKIQPFIATLAMMVFARGLAKQASGGQKVSTAVLQTDGSYQYVDIPGIFEFLNSKVLGNNIAVVTLVMLLCLALSWLVLDKLRWGRYLYAIGGNEEAARLSGVPVGAVKVLAYALSGLFCALAGVCQAAQELQGDPEAGTAYELSAIAIVVIGGTSLRGGKGGIGLTLLGILTIGYLEKILSINAVGEQSRLMLTGAIIIVAVLFQKRQS